MTFSFDSLSDEDEVKGLCGLHKDYVTTQERENYPWSAQIVVQVKNEDFFFFSELLFVVPRGLNLICFRLLF